MPNVKKIQLISGLPQSDMAETDSTKPSYIKNKPTSLPANGGNADTIDGKHADEFATATQGAKADTAYQKPASGIPKVDLSMGVQSSLDKADTAIQSLNGYATETYVDNKVAGLVNSAPEALDTLNELAEALGNDPNFATTVATEIGKKVDKVDGKRLSTEDFTSAEKLKLSGIEAGANNYSLPIAGNDSIGGVMVSTDSAISIDKNGAISVKDNSHNHTVENITDLQTTLDVYAKKTELPTSLPANGGNADTVDNKHASDFATAAQGTKADSAYQKPNDGIPTSDLTANVQSSLEKADTAYQKPNDGIPKSDLATAVQNSLNSADRALQPEDAYTTIYVNSDTLSATTTQGNISFIAGDNITLNPDWRHGHITISAKDTKYSVVTTSADGLMSSTDKTKLDGVEEGANNYALPEASSELGGVKTGGDVTIANGVITVKGGNADTVNNHTVNSDVPENAQFTDTVYTHPGSGVTEGTYKSVTVDANGHVTAGTNPATLDGYGITDAAKASDLSSHTGNTSNPHSVTKAQVGLGNVDNTADANKPVSTAQATAIADAKKAGTDAQSDINAHTANTNNPHAVTKAQVGLSNVTNDAQVKRSEMGTLNGVATLDENGKLYPAQLTAHTHDNIYYRQSEIDTQLSNKADKSHTHSSGDITSLDASKLTGTIDIARLPQGALERCVIVADDTARFALTTENVQIGDTVKVTATAKMYFVVDSSKLSSEDGYEVYTAGSATSVPWSGVTGKPSSYTPSSHTHTKSQITDFPTSMPASDVYAWAKASEKPTYTKSEIGLGNVDNKSSATIRSELTKENVTDALGYTPPIADTNTTYTLTQDAIDGHKITLTPSSGNATTIKIPDNNTTYEVATATSDGLMSSADKTKLDSIDSDNIALKSELPTSLPANGGNSDTVDGKHANDFATAAQGAKADTAVQSAFSTIYVDSTAMSSDVFSDSISIKSGSNISLTPNIAHGEITINANIPSSLPANGGNADTVDNKHASDFATSAQGAKADTAYQKPTGGIPATDLSANVQSSLGKADTAIQSLSGYATETYVNGKVAGIVNSAPEALDTLNELAKALGNDPNFATTVATEIGKKVDKVDGKGLSTNDYTDAYKLKLDSIENGANKYVLPVAGSGTIGGIMVSTDSAISLDGSGKIGVKDNSHNHTIANVTNLQTTLNSKVDKVDGKGLSANDYTTDEKNKLAGIAVGANKYVLPVAGSSLGGVKSGGDITVLGDGTVVVKENKNLIRSIDGRVYNTPKKIFDYIQSIYNYDDWESNIFSLNNGVFGGLIIYAPNYDGLYYIGDGDGTFYVGILNADDTTEISYAIESTLTSFENIATLDNLQGLATEGYVDSEITAQLNSAIGNINSVLDAINGEVI